MRINRFCAHWLAWVGLPLAALMFPTQSAHAATVQYTSQNSVATGKHSGIFTTTGIVWDTQFAGFVNAGYNSGVNQTANYNEAVFDFNECFGGGMIDELTTFGLPNVALTSASLYYEPSFSYLFPGAPTNTKPAGPMNWQSTYSNAYMAAVANKMPQLQAATTARTNDIAGPVSNKGFINPLTGRVALEHPQYTETSNTNAQGKNIADGIVLGGQNANGNPVKNNNYLAVLFCGNDLTNVPTGGVSNYNSLVNTYTTLTGLGYQPQNIYILYPYTGSQAQAPNGTAMSNIPLFKGSTIVNATAGNLDSALTFWVADNSSPTTQVFYWNAVNHGGKNGTNVRAQLPPTIQNNDTYTVSVTQDFVTGLQTNYTLLTSSGDTDPTDYPIVDIQTTSPLTSPLSVDLNGDAAPLTLLESNDLFGNGTRYDYEYAMSGSDDADLSTSDTLEFSSSSPKPDLSDVYFAYGDANSITDVPEPASASALLLLAFAGCGRRAWRAIGR